MDNIYTFYTEQIVKLATELEKVVSENNSLKEELNKTKGKLEVFERFYNDFNDQFNSKPEKKSIPKSIIKEKIPKPQYEKLLADYYVDPDSEKAESLFKDYNVPKSQVLTDIRNTFPTNIETLVNKYKCEDEYKIILRSNILINDFENNPNNEESGILELVGQYIKYYNNQNHSKAINVIKQVLIYNPYQIDMFLNNVKSYQLHNMNNIVDNLWEELYGQNKIPKKEENQKNKRPRINYLNEPIDNLVEKIKNGINKRQRALQTFEKLTELGRDDDECLLFVSEVNKFLTKEI